MNSQIAAALLAISFTFSAVASPDRNCERLLSSPPPTDSAVEFEPRTSPELFKLFTTIDGTVGALFGPDREAPPWFQRWAKKHFPGLLVDQIPWESLDSHFKIQHRLLQKHAQDAPAFSEARAIPALKYRNEIILRFEEPTRLFGRLYSVGEHRVKSNEFLRGPIEYVSEESKITFGGVEIHLRKGRDTLYSSQFNESADLFLKAVGLPPKAKHIYTIAPLSKEQLAISPLTESIRIADFYRRVELFAQMTDIIEPNGRGEIYFKESQDKHMVAFAPLDRTDLKTFATSLQIIGYQPEHSLLKNRTPPRLLGWIGAKIGDHFDNEDGLGLKIGLETRFIRPGLPPKLVKEFLDRIEYSLHTGDYTVPSDIIPEWIEIQTRRYNSALLAMGKPEIDPRSSIGEDELTELFTADMYYLGTPTDLVLQSAALSGSREFSNKWFSKIIRVMKVNKREFRNSHLERYMLIHDWSRDPLFYKNPVLIEQIKNEQRQALNLLEKGKKLRTIMRDFLFKSGIYTTICYSLGIQTPAY